MATSDGERLIDAVALMDRLVRQGAWEARQTHRSLSGYLIEETYELLDAIEADDSDQMCAELGDVLLQVLFHARIATGFTVDDVADSFIRKVSARSAGVLDGSVDLEGQVEGWERAKAAERPGGSSMDGIAMGQPALALAAKVLERARSAGVPDDVIPAGLASVSITADGGAEQRLRAEALSFAGRVRAAEQAMTVGGDGRIDPDQWRTALSCTPP